MLDEMVNGDRRRRRASGDGRVREGMGVVNIATADTVTVIFDTSRDREYGPVPFVWSATTGTPAAGDRAYLHTDPDGQPAYAVVWPT